MSKTNRKFERHGLHWAVEIEASDWAEVAQLTTVDVSRGGTFVRTPTPPPKGTIIKLALALPDGSRLKLEGKVVHAIDEAAAATAGKEPGFGLQFDERYAIDLNLLEAIVAAQVGKPGPMPEAQKGGLHLPDTLPGVGEVDEATRAAAPWASAAGDDPGKGRTGSQAALGKALQHKAAEAPPPSASVSFRAPSREAAPPPKDDLEIDLDVTVEAQSFPEDTIFGIDLGTTNTAIGAVTDGELRVFEDKEGAPFVPSVVNYQENGTILVGWEARDLLARQPMSTVPSIKRLLGRKLKDPKLEPLLGRMAIPTLEGPDGQVVLKIHGEPVAAPQIAAEILRHAAGVVERATGLRPKRVVVAGPIGWTVERSALRRAAELAGLQVAGWIDEPMAAALAYGSRSNKEEIVAVYDFGGGTFDVSIMRIKAGGGYETLATGGDGWLGGDDFDEQLTAHAANEFWRQTKVELHGRQAEWLRLRVACEGVKRRLSVQQEAELVVRGLALSIRGPLDCRVTFSRHLVETLCQGLVERSISALNDCLVAAKLTPSAVQRVVMVGGVARMPLVRERLQRYFERELRFVLNPEQAVVGGAAIYGAVLREAVKRGAPIG